MRPPLLLDLYPGSVLIKHVRLDAGIFNETENKIGMNINPWKNRIEPNDGLLSTKRKLYL